ncbi:MAG: hypothetical protein HYV09_31775 [Deltaproteobacteria bacterium]|nr:hypothetical protein [Deltaproteobacteria bacterium]
MRWQVLGGLGIVAPLLAFAWSTVAAAPSSASAVGSGASGGAAAAKAPTLVSALDHLKKAKAKLESAPDDPEGDRAQALLATDRAIVAVERALGVAPPGPVNASGKGLDGATIAATFAPQKGILEKICFKPYSGGGSASVKIEIMVGASGVVVDATLAEQKGGDARVGRCLLGQAWWWRFPASAGASHAVVPFAFTK